MKNDFPPFWVIYTSELRTNATKSTGEMVRIKRFLGKEKTRCFKSLNGTIVIPAWSSLNEGPLKIKGQFPFNQSKSAVIYHIGITE